ncbi:MAG TPA: hypothetical protein VFA60_03345 [Terriglobales bacterium]|nr:hypothetical protein [Terriglobales bacterium]
MALEEKDLYVEREQKKPARLACPHCRLEDDYELAWLVRNKKPQLPPQADERDRARFAKARNYMLRRDDVVVCKNVRCRKRFEVSGVQSVVFFDATPVPTHIEVPEPEPEKPKEDPRVAAMRNAFRKRY